MESGWTIRAVFSRRDGAREDITRSRGTKVRDAHFSEAANEELVNFCKACGFRRNVLERLKGGDLYDRSGRRPRLRPRRTRAIQRLQRRFRTGSATLPWEQTYFILHRNDKGGKTRLSPIVGPKAG